MRLSRLLPHSLVKDFVSLTYEDAVRRRLLTPFIAFLAFLLSFALARAIVYLFPSLNLIIGKYHIHHFYYGIALLITSNWVTLVSNREGPRLFAAGLFGLGLGILADEVGLLLTCTSPLTLQCNYFARITLDFFIIIVAFFLSVLYFIPAWKGFRRLARHTHGLVYGRIR